MLVRRNRERTKSSTAYTEMLAEAMEAARSGGDEKGAASSAAKSNPMDNLVDIREYDLPLHVRYILGHLFILVEIREEIIRR